ncbi:MAG: type III pantothenate kinase [Bacteroidetes bacterium]|nr:type III pantothenate kinase [Bacteroidota bacterium]
MTVTNNMNVLIIQVGNTSIKWATFHGQLLLEAGRSFELNDAELLKKHQEFNSVFFSCEASEDLKMKFQLAYPKAQEIPDNLYPEHEYHVGKPGYDRLANVAAASEHFPNQTCIIVDFGTCITYSICQNNKLVKGAISPGVYLRYKAMNEGTGKLPFIQNELNFSKHFGQNTNDNLIAGVSFGILNEINGFLKLATRDFENLQIVFTGADAAFFEKHLQYPIFVEENLTLRGLRKIIS